MSDQVKFPGMISRSKAFKNGAGYEIRTRDIQLGKLTLYQLS